MVDNKMIDEDVPVKEQISSILDTLSKRVADGVIEQSKTVQDHVIDQLVDQEIDKRVATVLKALVKAKELKKVLGKIKPDQALFNADGSTASVGFSKSRLDEMNKAANDVKNMDDALELALGKNDYTRLNKLIGG